MRKLRSAWLLTLAGFILLVGLGLYLFRLFLLESLINHQLDKRGIQVHSLAVTEVSFFTLHLRNVSVGADRVLQADNVYLTWRLQDLLAGTLGSVEINGLQLAIDLRAKHPPLGPLQPLIASSGKDVTPLKPPAVSLLDATIQLHTTQGDLTIALAGNLEPTLSGTYSAQLYSEISGPAGRIKSTLTATMDTQGNLQGNIMVLEGKLHLPELHAASLKGDAAVTLQAMRLQHLRTEWVLSDLSLAASKSSEQTPTHVVKQARVSLLMDKSNAHLTTELLSAETTIAHLQAMVRDYLDTPAIALALNTDASVSHYPWPLLGLAQPAAGSIALRARINGQLPAFQALRHNGLNAWSWLQQSTLAGQVQLELQELTHPQKISNLNGMLGFDLDLVAGTGTITLRNDSILTAASLDPTWLTSFGLPAELAGNFSQGGQLRLTEGQDRPTQISLSHQKDRSDLTAAVSLKLSSSNAQANISTHVELALDNQHELMAFILPDLVIQTKDIRYADMAIDQIKLAAAIKGSPAVWSGVLDLHMDGSRLAVGRLATGRVAVAWPMQIHYTHGTGRMKLQQAGRITLDKPVPMDTVSIQDSVSIVVSKAEIEWVKTSQSLALKHQLVATVSPFSLVVAQEQTPELMALIRPGEITLSGKLDPGKSYQGQGVINRMSLSLPQSQLQLENIAAKVYFGTGTDKIADFSIGQLLHEVAAPYLAPLSFSGSVTSKAVHGQPPLYTMQAIGGIAGRRFLSLTGEQGIESGDGRLKIELAPLAFIPGGLQPQALLPPLAQLEEVSGQVSAMAQFIWSEEGLRSSSGLLELDNVSFTHRAGKISKLNATLNLTDMLSPTTPPQQILTIGRIDPGIPMESLVVSYQIAGSPPRVALEKASLYLLGGIVSLGPTIIDPAVARNELVLLVDNIDLAVLLEQIEVTGLTGDGRLEGSIPITLENNQITIRNSRLVAELPGTLHFQSEKASQLLAGRAKEMDLLLQALQDFHYTELSLKLDKSAAHDLVATLSLLGNNPNVKHGQMFRLNINLESNIGEILEAINQGYSLSKEVLRDLFRLH